MLTITAFEKRYQNNIVLQIPTLSLPNGIYYLKGTNGSGKSTFLKCITGQIPFIGSICINNIALAQQKQQYLHHISYHEAEAALPPFFTGNQVIDYYLHVKKGNRNAVNNILEAFQMQAYLPNTIGTYSSGMLKKLTLTLSFIGDNKWICLDEPFTTIDNASATILIDIIKQYHQNQTSFIITSHHEIEVDEHYFTGTLIAADKTIKAI
jgi:ABC-2 type transport system ATP-binding protein